ncbi:hypothetical protein [Telluribacter sp. SYSU D00476]|uniref:hypothetical protein n=1 Tax=Telluribacter sp. SYSU D00476 TaxID=2811430 RepID=UPI001FF67F78|nr:hypothetical protein [Telluribacter sp. SYSU D00476]
MKKFLRLAVLMMAVSIEVANAGGVPLVWKWLDWHNDTFYRINFKTRVFERQTKDATWEVLGKLRTVNFDELDRSPTIEVPHVIPLNETRRDSLYIQIPGTGQVFLFTTNNATLERLDRTYYRGYNFRAEVFMRKGQLYSVGGCGFWTQINSMTTYLPTAREWEIIVPKSESPAYIMGDLTHYIPSRDVVISGLNFLKDSFHKDYTGQVEPTYWEYAFATNTWSRKGAVNAALVEDITENLFSFSSHLVEEDKLIIARHDRVPSLTLYYVNLSTNKLYRYPEILKTEDCDSVMVSKGVVYVPVDFTTYATSSTKRITMDEIARGAVLIGDFVQPVGGTPTRQYLYWIVPGLVLLAVGGYWVVKKQKGKSVPPVPVVSDQLSDLDEQERRVLRVFMDAYPAALSADELHNLLLLEAKSMDNQRKLRNDFLNAFNTKLKLIIQEEESIIRVANEKDRRINDYVLKKEAWEKLNGSLVIVGRRSI